MVGDSRSHPEVEIFTKGDYCATRDIPRTGEYRLITLPGQKKPERGDPNLFEFLAAMSGRQIRVDELHPVIQDVFEQLREHFDPQKPEIFPPEEPDTINQNFSSWMDIDPDEGPSEAEREIERRHHLNSLRSQWRDEDAAEPWEREDQIEGYYEDNQYGAENAMLQNNEDRYVRKEKIERYKHIPEEEEWEVLFNFPRARDHLEGER